MSAKNTARPHNGNSNRAVKKWTWVAAYVGASALVLKPSPSDIKSPEDMVGKAAIIISVGYAVERWREGKRENLSKRAVSSSDKEPVSKTGQESHPTAPTSVVSVRGRENNNDVPEESAFTVPSL
jgi:hypothetical protein